MLARLKSSLDWPLGANSFMGWKLSFNILQEYLQNGTEMKCLVPATESWFTTDPTQCMLAMFSGASWL